MSVRMLSARWDAVVALHAVYGMPQKANGGIYMIVPEALAVIRQMHGNLLHGEQKTRQKMGTTTLVAVMTWSLQLSANG